MLREVRRSLRLNANLSLSHRSTASTLLAGVCVARSADALALSQAVLNAMVNTMSRAHRIFELLVKLLRLFFISHWSHLTVT